MKKCFLTICFMVLTFVLLTACEGKKDTGGDNKTQTGQQAVVLKPVTKRYVDIGSSGEGGAFVQVDPSSYLKKDRVLLNVYANHSNYEEGTFQVHYFIIDGTKYETSKRSGEEYPIGRFNEGEETVLFKKFGIEEIDLKEVESITMGIKFFDELLKTRSTEVTIYPLEEN